MFRTLPLTTEPGGYFSATRSHGFSSTCFMPREISCLSLLISRTLTWTRWLAVTSSEGWLMRLVQDISEMWTRPSIPGSSLTKAPYDITLTTSPECRLLIGYFFSTVSHGLGDLCLSERAIFSLSLSTERM